jgi:hypothetical protein
MVLSWLTFAGVAHGQVNTDSLAGQAAAGGPALGFGASAGLTTGNVASTWWRAEATAMHVTLFPEDDDDSDDDDEGEGEAPEPPPFLRDRLLLYGTANRASYAGDVVDDHGLSHLRYTHMWVPRFGTEAFAQLQYDRFLDLRERLLLGGGVRIDAVHSARASVWGGTGAMFERETLSEGTVNVAVRSTSYLTVRWQIVPDHLTLSNTAYLQPKVDDPADFRFLDEGRLAATVTKALTIGTDLVVRHDARPPVDVLTTDVRLGMSVQIQWSKPPTPPQ